MDHSQRNEVEYLLEGDYIGGGWFGIFHYTPTEWQGLKCNSSQLFYFLKKILWDGYVAFIIICNNCGAKSEFAVLLSLLSINTKPNNFNNPNLRKPL